MRGVLGGLVALFGCASVVSNSVEIRRSLRDTTGLKPIDMRVRSVQYRGRTAVQAFDVPRSIEGRLILVSGTEMLNGTIELDVAGRPMEGATPDARGFIGVAFRAVDDTTFDAFYIRPTNGRADDQVRRNHSTQYIAAPEYPFTRLRAESPEAYESYVDLAPGEWTHLRVVVSDTTALLYVNHASQPALVVNQLKGRRTAGLVGLWVGDQTDAYFSNLVVRR